MKARMTILTILVAFWCLLGGCALDIGNAPVSAPWDKTASPITWVVVADVSQSTRSFRGEYLSALARILQSVRYGDTVVVMSAENDSVQNSRFWVEYDVPALHYVPSTPRPDTDNADMLNAWIAKQTPLYKTAVDKFKREHSLADVRRHIIALSRDPLAHDVAVGTDIFGALYVAGTLFSATPGERRLVLLSDGLVVTPEANWHSGAVTRASVDRVLAAQRRTGRLPDLRATSVVLVGANTSDPVRFASLEQGWQLYLAATNGDLAHFMRRYSSTILDQWLPNRPVQ
jgi:hypothetical protein